MLLADLNQAFWLTDLVEDSDLVVPVDETRIGTQAGKHLVAGDSQLHRATFPALLMDNLLMQSTQG